MSIKPTAATHSAIKVLDVLEAVSGFTVQGASNKTLAELCGMDAAAITRAAATLIQKGWVRKDEGTGHFHPTPRMGQIFGRVLADISRRKTELDDLTRNFNPNA